MRTSSRTRPPLLLLLLVPLALLVSGCGSDDDGDESSGAGTTTDDGSGATEPAPLPGDDDPLAGRTLIASSVTEGGEDRVLVEGTQLHLTFADGVVSASAGCNTMSAGYTFADGELTIETEMATTSMGCLEDVAAQDAWLAEVLARAAQVEEDADEVTLTFGDTVLVLSDAPTAELLGHQWYVDTLIEGTDADGTASSVDPSTVGASLFLDDDGTYTVATGCNSGGGASQLDEEASTITFELPRLTRMACTDDAAQAVETAMVALLEGDATYEIDEQSLTLTNDEGGLGFQAG